MWPNPPRTEGEKSSLKRECLFFFQFYSFRLQILHINNHDTLLYSMSQCIDVLQRASRANLVLKYDPTGLWEFLHRYQVFFSLDCSIMTKGFGFYDEGEELHRIGATPSLEIADERLVTSTEL